MLPIPTRIRAVAENPEALHLDCYPGNTKEDVSRIIARRTTTPSTPKGTPVMLNFTNYDSRLAQKAKI
jgi:hypothetical protein